MSSPSNIKNEPVEDAGIPLKAATAPDAQVETEDSKKDIEQLEDLFDDVDSDEEFPSSVPIQLSSQIAPGSPK